MSVDLAGRFVEPTFSSANSIVSAAAEPAATWVLGVGVDSSVVAALPVVALPAALPAGAATGAGCAAWSFPFTSTITPQDALNGNVNNSATVAADALGVAVTDTALAECPFNPVEGVEITKSCPVIPAGTRAGASISYQVTIRNIGDVPLTNVVVTDTRTGSFNEPFPTELAAGASATRTFTSTITLADAAAGNVNNSATVTANALRLGRVGDGRTPSGRAAFAAGGLPAATLRSTSGTSYESTDRRARTPGSAPRSS